MDRRPDARGERRAAFLAAAGVTPESAAPLAGDASNRRYFRAGGHILMDAPPELGEDVRPFIAVTHWLRALGLSAPEVLAADDQHGFLLLEDLGEGLFSAMLRDGAADEEALYCAAVDLLADAAGVSAPDEIGPPGCRVELAPYGAAVLTREARLMTEWWVPAATDEDASGAMSDELDVLVIAATAEAEAARDVVVLRDYHADNLIWLPERDGTARVGLLDYQDALAGHPAYDLMSLLEDARRDTSDALREAMIERYLARRPELEPGAFRAAYAALGAQRNMKIVGIFARLALRDGKPRYLSMIPRVWRHLQRDLAHPALGELAAWVSRRVPIPSEDVLARFAGRVGT
ncbi:MAG: phosphotransferase [Paracoccaceae bacterium]|nr:phosphotransferase [Paracoccaceae bacterium]